MIEKSGEELRKKTLSEQESVVTDYISCKSAFCQVDQKLIEKGVREKFGVSLGVL